MPDEDAAGFVLAGGQSRRMGTEKAFVEVGGRPLIAHAIGILSRAGVSVRIAGSSEHARGALERYAPVIPDKETGLGPLGGVCAALGSSSAGLGVFLPIDMPFMPSSLVEYLVRHAKITGAAITLASVNGREQTFPVVISRRALPTLEEELREGRLGCLLALRSAARALGESESAISAEVLVQSGQVSHPAALPVIRWFMNLNAGGDVRQASTLWSAPVS